MPNGLSFNIKNKIMQFTGKYVELEVIILRESQTQTQKDK